MAPGRVNLMGEHVDYCEGLVLPMAVERAIRIRFAKNSSRTTRIVSRHFAGDAVEIRLDQSITPGEPKWANYMRGVIDNFARSVTRPIPGFDALVESDLPPAAGLSSSAALEIATATMLESLTGQQLSLEEKALLCQLAEHEFVGVPCGIMDQLAVAMGRRDHLLLIDCRDRRVRQVPFADPGLTILVANTNVARELDSGHYAVRRGQAVTALQTIGKTSWRDVTAADLQAHRAALGGELFRRARHVVSETERTAACVSALEKRDFNRFGQLMDDSHRSLAEDYEVSCHELDAMVEAAQRIGSNGGVLGSRMTGGGFGGSTVSLVETDKLPSVVQQMGDAYLATTGIQAEFLTSRPADGARFKELS